MELPDLVRRSTLLGEGITPAEVEQLVARGRYRRVGRGWLAGENAPADQLAAVAAGYRLTCLDVARQHGLWTPLAHGGPHVYTSRGIRIPPPSGHRRHLPDAVRLPAGPSAPLLTALRHAVGCLAVADAAGVLESALQQRLVTVAEVVALLRDSPRHRSKSLWRMRTDAESGTETRVRWWLESHRIRVRSQVQIPGVGRVDLLVGRRWVIECDSRAHHTGEESYAGDRRRDLELRRLDYLVTRLTWEQVFLEWAQTAAALEAVLALGDHLRPRRNPLAAVGP